MAFKLTGIVTSARPIVAEDNSYGFYAMNLALQRGGFAECQVWNNDPLFKLLVEGGESLLNHKVKASVVTYSAGERKMKDGSVQPQARFRINKVEDLGLPSDESELIGTVSSARAITAEDGAYNFLAIDIDTRRAKYACQIWDNDPEYVRVGPAVSNLVDHKVKVSVVGFNVGYRKLKDNSKQAQARFRITNVVDLGLDTDEA